MTNVDLRGWKLTLPVGKPDEIRDLAGFKSEHFESGPDGLLFRAPVEGVTTKGSSYPRCELRELALWSTESGTHTMSITQAITRLPARKPHVVAGQIHDARDDVIMIRLEGKTLFVEGGGKDLGLLDPAYALGTFFDVKVVAAASRIRVAYNGADKVDVERPAVGCYFKAGVYTQSNLEKGDVAGERGEVRIRALSVRHE
ncbi:MAG TPA: polysaccharide lyase family 7 protein [Planctomycetota bacterium]